MLELLSDETRWVQGMYANGQDAARTFCLVGAYGQLTRKNPFNADYSGARFTYLHRVLRVIREQFPDRLDTSMEDYDDIFDVGDLIVSFNDHPDTVFGDVRLVMEKAR